MARLQDGIFGGFSGKVGHVVGVRRYGQDFLRSYPVKNNKPPSRAQQLQREKFQVVLQFLGPLLEVYKTTFTVGNPNATAYNRAMSYHLSHALVAQGNHFAMVYPKVLIAAGPLSGIQAATLARTDAQTVRLQWADNSQQGLAAATDGLLVVLYTVGNDAFAIYNTAAVRNDAEAQLPLPDTFIGQELHCWATFVALGDGLVATSTYLGVVAGS